MSDRAEPWVGWLKPAEQHAKWVSVVWAHSYEHAWDLLLAIKAGNCSKMVLRKEDHPSRKPGYLGGR